MTIQTINLGDAPSGAGGDTFRATGVKINENFSNPANAASRQVGLSNGNLVEKQNIGSAALTARPSAASGLSLDALQAGAIVFSDQDVGKPLNSPNFLYSMILTQNTDPEGIYGRTQIAFDYLESNMAIRAKGIADWRPWAYFLTTLNTTVDSNGFIKAASPIIRLFADKIEPNDEAKAQECVFEKLGLGDYLIKGSSGLAQGGWYIETPKDANGNVLFSVIYGTLDNGDISVKTYKKKFDLETASIVADLAQPVDISDGRWIDIRLQELPPPEFSPVAPNTPASFQPTGIAQAVSEMMNGTEQ